MLEKKRGGGTQDVSTKSMTILGGGRGAEGEGGCIHQKSKCRDARRISQQAEERDEVFFMSRRSRTHGRFDG